MTTTIPDLWPDDIRVDVLAPLVILRTQESNLRRRTQGILEGHVSTVEDNGLIYHKLDVFAPALGYSRTVLAAKHGHDSPYPVTVISQAFVSKPKAIPIPAMPFERPDNERDAATEDEFIKLVREVLQSGHVKAIVQSLIARSNELRELLQPPEAPSPAPEAAPGDAANGAGK